MSAHMTRSLSLDRCTSNDIKSLLKYLLWQDWPNSKGDQRFSCLSASRQRFPRECRRHRATLMRSSSAPAGSLHSLSSSPAHLRYDEYDYFKAQIIEHVVLKSRKVEGAKGDYEFTDWTALFAAVELPFLSK